MFWAPGELARRIRRKMEVCAIHYCEEFEEYCTGRGLWRHSRRKDDMVEATNLILKDFKFVLHDRLLKRYAS